MAVLVSNGFYLRDLTSFLAASDTTSFSAVPKMNNLLWCAVCTVVHCSALTCENIVHQQLNENSITSTGYLSV